MRRVCINSNQLALEMPFVLIHETMLLPAPPAAPMTQTVGLAISIAARIVSCSITDSGVTFGIK
jgi:hypothetical protein